MILLTDEEWYILVKVWYGTPSGINSGSGKYISFGLKIETGAERTTIVDIFDIIQQVFLICVKTISKARNLGILTASC